MAHGCLAHLVEIAAGQHHLFTSAQAHDCGVDFTELARRTEQGWFRRVRRGVYAFAGNPPSQWEAVMAAALAAGSEAVVSHRSAAAIHGLWQVGSHVPELTVRAPCHVQLAGVQVHQASHLDAQDIVRRSGVAVTSPVRTLVDISAVLPAVSVARILEDGVVQRRWTYDEATACLVRSGRRGRAGAELLRVLLASAVVPVGVSSRLEARVVRILEPFGPFELQHHVVVHDKVFLIDVAWPHWKVGAEVDGRQHDGSSMAEFTRDRSRRNVLEGAGWRIAHVTAAMSPEQIMVDVGRLLPSWFAGPILAVRGLGLAG